ncbi:fungal ATP synthase protein 8-domain-containing protein [Lophiotrema nucula]|uniref:ATP synthase protein 8 n=1 Tax=Lophiotrema nucula TaxID=690887 RepID=A0A6A5Z846_9PLEO|nr:fungal ATP synthase protein 8-domain-containing protein [Lophiotrema nucula]
MNSTRFLRPLTRAFRQPTAIRPAVMARPAIVSTQVQAKKTQSPMNMTVLKSAMPQLVPFFMVNETTFAFILIPSLIYVFSKYILPQRVRLFAARLFISKL